MNSRPKKILQNFLKQYQLENNNPVFIPFFRIATGLILILLFLSFLKDFNLLYGLNSIIPSDIHTVYSSSEVVNYNQIIELINILVGDEIVAVNIFKFIFITLCVFVIIGFYSRIFAIFLLLAFTSLIKSSGLYSYGVDFFLMMSLLYISILPSDDYYSILKNKTKSRYTIQQKTFQIHICIAYFVSGLEKLSGYNWRNGESIWKAIHLPSFGNDFTINIDFLGKYPILFICLSWFTILVELLYPFFVLNRKTRLFWLYATMSMHLGIAIFLNLYFFSVTLIVWNLTAFYFKDGNT
ncbi:hypothetical protein [Flavobacterium sp.]|uniref:hypothetical protein n=1 Tax=Flavobacterium sp. TaxID=239 RepID=UPI0037BF18AB